MKTYVLIHGAWHGGWCWSRVVPRLVAAGHRVFAPSLTGLGDRAHLFGAHVDLSLHVQDVLELVQAEELEGFVLVGHSYGGNVVAGVADALRERVTHCVLLDAVVPPDDVVEWRWCEVLAPPVREQRFAAIRDQGCGIALPAPEPASFGVDDPADLRWLARRLRPMPAATFTGAIRLANGGTRGLRRTYVAATNPGYAPLAPVQERVRATPGWRFLELDTGHDMMLTAPSALSQVLLGC